MGKSPVVSRSEGRDTAPGHSIAIIARKTIGDFGWGIEDTTVAIQGSGPIGVLTMRPLDDEGATVVAVSNVNGAIYNPNGLDTHDVSTHEEGPEAVMKYDAP